MSDALKRISEGALRIYRLFMSRTTPGQRWWMGSAMAGVLAVTAGLMWLSTRTDWRPLYTNLDPRDGQQAAAELAAEKIPYQFDADGSTLRVPVQSIDRARLGLAAKGLPQSGRLGFELFDKPNWVGSEFDEKVNYQRALEGELEHTIGSMGAIQSARVHLVLPHDSLFASEQRLAKASVVIKLTRRSLSDTEADSIRTLVASAVDGLDPNNVTLVDADGRVSFGPKTAQAETALYEQQLVDRLMATLEPVAGRDNIRASVNVDYDTSSQDEIQEVYDPKTVVMASTERSDESSGGGQPKPAGIPGTASNAPNAGGATNGSTPPNPLPLFTTAAQSTDTLTGGLKFTITNADATTSTLTTTATTLQGLVQEINKDGIPGVSASITTAAAAGVGAVNAGDVGIMINNSNSNVTIANATTALADSTSGGTTSLNNSTKGITTIQYVAGTNEQTTNLSGSDLNTALMRRMLSCC